AEFGFTEMISAKSVILNISVNEQYLPKSDEICRVGIQLFGNDPIELAEAGSIIQERGFWVDLNAGCPVNKVVKKGAGSALLKDLKKFREVVREMRRVLKRFTVKTRLGWEADEFEKIYNILVEEQVDAIFVHGRTAKQLYSGKATWKIYNPGILPLFISGDLYTIEDVENAIFQSNANGAIVARGSVGNPWIFQGKKPSIHERINAIFKHLEYLNEEYGEYGAIVFRKFVAGYTKDIPQAREFRAKVMKLKMIREIQEAFLEFFGNIQKVTD
ncbi:MAG: tRNA dihydrouridine synthase, partial [Fervidobacterium sp.]